jgi:hypothetical protein
MLITFSPSPAIKSLISRAEYVVTEQLVFYDEAGSTYLPPTEEID